MGISHKTEFVLELKICILSVEGIKDRSMCKGISHTECE